MESYIRRNGSSEYSWDTIEKAKSLLDSGKILYVGFLYNEENGHAVNVYDYFEDTNDPSITWFKVYDSNYPQDKSTWLFPLRYDSACLLRVQKKKALFGNGDTFSYEYYPSESAKKSSSEVNKGNAYALVFSDSSFHILNS